MPNNRSVCPDCGDIYGEEYAPNCSCGQNEEVPITNDVSNDGIMRNFGTGATRNSDDGKLDYEGFFHPLVVERYAQYMNKHRKQADGKLRDSDNWQKLFGEQHLSICMKSGFRHFHDWWKQHRGFKGQDTLEESICALLFNAQAYLLKILLDKEKKEGN